MLPHDSQITFIQLGAEHPQFSAFRVGESSKEHYHTFLQPHHWVKMLRCSSNNLSTLYGVFKRLRCVQRSDWRLAFKSLHNFKSINLSFLLFCFVRFFGPRQFCPRYAFIKRLELGPVRLSKPSKNVDKQIPEMKSPRPRLRLPLIVLFTVTIKDESVMAG